MEVRLASLSDVPAMTQIVARAYQKYIDRMGKAPGPMLDDYAARVRSRAAWVTEVEGVVAGLIVLIPKEEHLLLDNIAVDPARQGAGIGHALFDFAEQQALRSGYAELRLYTHEKMTENLAMYPALGWKETGRGEQDGYERVFFCKQLR